MKKIALNLSLNGVAGATGLPNASFFNSAPVLNASRILQQRYLTVTAVIVPKTIQLYVLCENASLQLQGSHWSFICCIEKVPLLFQTWEVKTCLD